VKIERMCLVHRLEVTSSNIGLVVEEL
jgi:hypothetical protein